MGLKEVVLTKDDGYGHYLNALADRYQEDDIDVDKAGSVEPTMSML